ncbi:M10 family metallopeptidase C-terminal domain-containing protein [Bradyrhizobium japonicum]|uniref:M10 family metallopeptidase C-terminal domain-containing protein n=1 Tax=Bradyrhizobium japonicum TaxID=375 RepID=UPI001BACB841|nr:M10 family metallopeptidase C-terminal domain-containing protein [Bradyrhizobium japonicum]MBR0995224.1 M10 family metallopeptidase C-terminal domain-containing protein [Bradyrhizobium japonicum]
MASVVSVSATGNQDIDGLLGGTAWSGIVTYSFPDSPLNYSADYGYGETTDPSFSAVPAAIQTAVIYAVSLVMSYTNLVVQFAGADNADIAIAQTSVVNPTSWAYLPDPAYAEGGDAWFGTTYDFSEASLGNYYFADALHELGHSFGLKHSQDGGGVANVALPTAHDNLEYTVMSYRSYAGADVTGSYANEDYGYVQTYMANDILALQTMYGANFATQSGNTMYTWNPTTGQEFINGVGQPMPGDGIGGAANRIFETIWDGGGIDTYDLSNYVTDLRINLNPGASSLFSTDQLAYLGDGHYASGNVYNAYLYNSDARSYIDNAIGGSGNDTLIGNAIANTLIGGAGNDTMTGGGGNDVIFGGSGTDTAVYSGVRASYNVTYNAATQIFTIVDLRSGAPDGTDTVSDVELFQFSDGMVASTALYVSTNVAPVVSAVDVTPTLNQNIAASSLFYVNDADGDSIGAYQLLDATTDPTSGHFVVGGIAKDARQVIDVSAGQLSGTTFQSGSGSDDLWVRAFDGTAWGAWKEFHVGGVGADVSTGSTGNDRLSGGPGSDTIDGGGGVDTAAFSGSPENFRWSLNPDGSFNVTDLRPGSPEGTDLVRNVELLEFSSDPNATGGTTTTTQDVGNAFPWSIEIRTYDAQGKLNSIFDKNDVGPGFLTDYNTNHVNPWNMAVTTYDEQGRLQATSIYKEVTLVTSYDYAGNQSWSQAITGYDSQGRPDYVTVVNDNGSSLYTRYSYSGNVDYAIYTYDSQNHLAQSYIHHPNGTYEIV